MRFPGRTPEPADKPEPGERDILIEELAQKVVDRKLETPVIMFLEMHKPISFLASQAMIVAEPVLVPLFGPEGVRKYSQILDSPENVELLIERIEDLSDERRRKKD